MKKSTPPAKPAGPSTAADQQKDARPERDNRDNRARPARDHHPEFSGPPTANSDVHNGSASAFGATEEVRDDEDSEFHPPALFGENQL